ncbi:DNA primase [uncultured Eubacteriales bacterium]|uniref:DNA primase n=1 Tax=uncultured Eubacteriales bacterium TaxID=172733 RepID=A0A212K254_9FIRM|nr:DNA primase [uncultured Eubacteriales bacterium]
MAIPEQFIDELLARSDIVDVVGGYVTLNKKGANYWGLCPFHNEKTPSFSVSQEKQIYKCFGCGKGGGAISFIMEEENLSFVDAVKLLAQRAGMEVPETGVSQDESRKKARALEANKEAARFYNDYLKSPGGAQVRAYIEKRQISPRTATRFGLGAAPNAWDELTKHLTANGFSKMELIDAGLAVANKSGGVYDKFRSRLMLPVIDVNGTVAGFTSRILPGEEGAKYLNSPDTIVFKKGRLIYGLNLAKNSKRGNIILVEGNIDVISLHQAGFDNVVATMGTALTEDHARLLARYTKELVICYDNDGAGRHSTERALGILKNTTMEVRVLQLPNPCDPAGNILLDEKGQPLKQDPDDFIKKFGAAAFEKHLNGSAGQNDYWLDNLVSEANLTTPEGRIDFVKKAAEKLAGLPSPIEREIYGGKAAAAADITSVTMAQEVEQYRKNRDKQEKRKQERRDLTPTLQLQPKERGLRYENLRSARAEEGVLRLMVMDPALFRQTGGLEVEEFSAPLLGRVFAILKERHENGRSTQLAALAGDLTAEEMNHMVRVIDQPEDRSNSRSALKDYIEIIRTEGLKRRVGDETDPLLAAREKYREKKAYGG